jgi:hypothetical protein
MIQRGKQQANNLFKSRQSFHYHLRTLSTLTLLRKMSGSIGASPFKSLLIFTNS